MRLLAITGSHRRNGNSYALSNAILDPLDCERVIIQLAEKEIGFCTVCEECVAKGCVLEDDLDEVLGEMERSDGLIFAVPKYLSAPSKFMAFLERLASMVHMRKHLGYGGPEVNPNYVLFQGRKPFCVFALSGRGEFDESALRTVVDYLEYLGFTPVSHDQPPFVAVNLRAGNVKGEVLDNKEAIEQCRKLVRNLMASVCTT
ncbi:MAG: flavodoxin family protein [Candidatus Bathyarchaeota archaeon]|nr:flavodoxin family protein [Candidatus Bathyarchaeota archaeon]